MARHLWYGQAFWKRGIQPQILKRDPLCVLCIAAGRTPYPPSTVVDHVIPHNGNLDLFTDPKNLRGLCKPCHDRKTATQDGGFGNAKPQPVSMFAGQPGSVSTVSSSTIDKALGSEAEIAALLDGI
jgi:hypothetical protein